MKKTFVYLSICNIEGPAIFGKNQKKMFSCSGLVSVDKHGSQQCTNVCVGGLSLLSFSYKAFISSKSTLSI